MIKKTVRLLSMMLLGVCLSTGLSTDLSTAAKSVQGDQSIESFWTKFKAAVIKGDKTAVARMSRFPIGMPYGMGSVRTSAQLSRRYREVFNGETNAAKCFTESKPEVVPQDPKRFTVGCKINNTGDVVIIYGFVRTRTGWKFAFLDNINE